MSAREPITIVELEQPRCALRFGVGTCTATGTKCYNTLGTCGDLPNYDGTGSIKWRFTDGRPGVYDCADFSDADNPEMDPLPCGVQVSTSEGQINAGSNLGGRDPLGVTAKVTVSLSDFPWNDRIGDHYISDRSWYVSGKPLPSRANFWALWTARNSLFTDMYLRVYDGYVGQSLSAMRQRLYFLDKVNGPNGGGSVTLTGLDPLRLAGDKRAEFPRTSRLDLYGDTDATTTTVQVFGFEDDLSDAFGNTGTDKFLSIGTEIIKYTGYTDEGDGVFTLTGVERAALGTVADEYEDAEKVQRAGRFDSMSFWLVLEDLLKNHTDVLDTFVPIADWNTEGNTYLPTYRATRTIVAPTPVKDLIAQITQQGLFYIWWSEYDQEIQMLAVRPPDDSIEVLTDDANLLRGSALTRDPSIRLTQVAIYYDEISPFEGQEDAANYRSRYTAVDGDNMGEVRTLSIFAPWITNRTQAVQLAIRLLIRFRAVPKFLSVSVDAKDRTITLGSVVDIETRTLLDSEGNLDRSRWQVISAKEIKAGHSYALNCQTYEFIGRFGRYVADGSPDYDAATAEQQAAGSWYAADDGLLANGDQGYQYQ